MNDLFGLLTNMRLRVKIRKNGVNRIYDAIRNGLKEDGTSELLTNCKQLKMKADD